MQGGVNNSKMSVLFGIILLLACARVRADGSQISPRPVNIGLLWDQVAVPEVIHLERSVKAMVNISTLGLEDSVDVVLVEVTRNSPFAIYNEICSAMEKGTVVFITALSCPSLLPTLTALADLQVPAIVVENYCDTPASFPDNVLPFPLVQTDINVIINAAVKDSGWKNIALIYDIHHVTQFDDVTNSLADSNATVQGLRLRPGNVYQSVSEIIEYISNNFTFNNAPDKFFVICSLGCMTEFFIQANMFDRTRGAQGWFGFKTSWLLLVEDTTWLTILEPYIRDIDNVAAIGQVISDPKSLESLVEEAISHVLYSVRDLSALTDLSNVDSRPSGKVACGLVSEAAFWLKEAIKRSVEESSCYNCTVYGVYTAFRKPEGRKFDIALEWSPAGFVRHGPVFPNTKFQLNARHFHLATNIWNPFVIFDDNGTRFEGLCMELLKHLAVTLNFTYDLTLPPDGAWGSFTNGSWNGLVAMLERKDIDMTIAPLSITVSREKVMDFTEPFYLEYSTVLLKLPNPDDLKWALYLSPFKWEVWMSIVASVIISGVILWLFTRYSPFYDHESLSSGLAKLDNAILYTLGSLFTQGGIYLPKAQSGRFFVGFWWMYCVVMVATYSGNLIAFLTVTMPTMPFNNLEEMVNQSDYVYGTLGGAFLEDYFMDATSGIFADVGNGIRSNLPEHPDILGYSHDEHMNKVFEGKYAYIQDVTSFEIAMSTVCDVEMFKQEFLAVPYAMGLQNNSAYRDIVSDGIRIIKEGGLINRWKQQWWPRQSFCARGLITESKPVTLKDVQGIYYALVFLISCASVTLIIEFMLTSQIGKGKDPDDNEKSDQAYNNKPVQNGAIASGRPPAGYEYSRSRPPAGHEYTGGNFENENYTSNRPPAGWEYSSSRPPSGWEYTVTNKFTPASYDYSSKEAFSHNFHANYTSQFMGINKEYYEITQ